MKALKITGVVLAVLVVAVLLIGGYFGVVPWVSRLFGSNKPRDLGVKLTVENAYAGADIPVCRARQRSSSRSSTTRTRPRSSTLA
ncbi:MAG: hypothetical protein Q8K99_10620 [Actinomycetota bacterium]|nr:hypothetical protein [Actinomycetota bacterium]